MRLARLVLTIGLAGCFPAFAQFFPISSPTAAYTTQTTLIPITGLDSSSVPSLSGGGQTITFSTNLSVFTVPTGGWNAWAPPPDTESSTPRVLASGVNQTSLTMTLSTAVNTFGFEIEPANVGGVPPVAFTISATFFSGATNLGTVTRSITNTGARLEAASSTTPITSVQITAPLAAGGFAMAQFRSGNVLIGAPTVPAVGLPALGGLALLLAASASFLARRHTANGL
jgi:hypothetical protein